MSTISENFSLPPIPSAGEESGCCLWQAVNAAGEIIVRAVSWIGAAFYALYRGIVGIAEKVYRLFYQIYMVCLIESEASARSEIPRPNLQSGNLSEGQTLALYINYARRVFTPAVEMPLSRGGLDPGIDPAHLSNLPPAQIRIGNPPDCDIHDLMPLFDGCIHEADLDLHLSDADTPIADTAELRRGLEKFISFNLENRYANCPRIVALAKHLVHFLSQEACDPLQKRQCLVELARAGHRGCPTRMNQACTHYFHLFSGSFVFQIKLG